MQEEALPIKVGEVTSRYTSDEEIYYIKAITPDKILVSKILVSCKTRSGILVNSSTKTVVLSTTDLTVQHELDIGYG